MTILAVRILPMSKTKISIVFKVDETIIFFHYNHSTLCQNIEYPTDFNELIVMDTIYTVLAYGKNIKQVLPHLTTG